MYNQDYSCAKRHTIAQTTNVPCAFVPSRFRAFALNCLKIRQLPPPPMR